MLPTKAVTPLSEDAYHRAHVHYEKPNTLTESITQKLVFVMWFEWTLLLPVASFLLLFLPFSTILIILLVGAILFATMFLTLWIMDIIATHHRYRDFDYRIAFYFMRELGHENPRAALENTPEYLTSFQTVFKAASEEFIAAGKPLTTQGAHLYETYSPVLRIASLVLYDEESIGKMPQLLSFIKDQHITDYDQLFALMHPTV